MVQGATLYVREPRLTQEDASFDKACRKLLKAKGSTYTVDLSAVKIVTSTFIGVIAVTYLDAERDGKKLVIKAPTKVLDIFRLAGFGGKIEMVEVPYTPAK